MNDSIRQLFEDPYLTESISNLVDHFQTIHQNLTRPNHDPRGVTNSFFVHMEGVSAPHTWHLCECIIER